MRRAGADARAGRPARVTIVDVARAAGVRPSTVSKALNGRGSAEVRRRVDEAVARLGYRPSARAQGLRTAQSRSIGVLVPDLVNPSYLALLRGVEHVAQERGYVVLVADGQRSADTQAAVLERFFEHGVDGLVLGGPVPVEALRLHLQHGVPISPSVSDDERALARHWEQGEADATREMGRRLLDLGHRRFALVSTPALPGSGRFRRGRVLALWRLLAEAGAELSVSLVDPDRDPEGCRAQLRALLAGGDDGPGGTGDRGAAPTALVCVNQLVAPSVLIAARDAGRRVPDDLSVVVYGDSDWAQAHPPPLSVVARDTFAEGRSLAAALLDTIAGVESPRRPATEARYIERGSCAPAAP
ncbi:MAG TPA: LacI family DNA-binding transcriptional regulator [Acidimicrobiales bacterium]